jgi:hypothetical protein
MPLGCHKRKTVKQTWQAENLPGLYIALSAGLPKAAATTTARSGARGTDTTGQGFTHRSF